MCNSAFFQLFHARVSYTFNSLFDADSIGQATMMILVNAVYFKGDWLNQFDSKLTEIKPFIFLGTGKCKVDVEMMRLTGKFLTGEIDSLDAEFIVLPYKV